jgi:hypothetical protein
MELTENDKIFITAWIGVIAFLLKSCKCNCQNSITPEELKGTIKITEYKDVGKKVKNIQGIPGFIFNPPPPAQWVAEEANNPFYKTMQSGKHNGLTNGVIIITAPTTGYGDNFSIIVNDVTVEDSVIMYNNLPNGLYSVSNLTFDPTDKVEIYFENNA